MTALSSLGSLVRSALAVAVIVIVIPGSSWGASATADPPRASHPALGTPAVALRWLRERDFSIDEEAAPRGTRRWVGRVDGATVTLVGTGRALSSIALSLDLTRAIGRVSPVGLVLQVWVEAFAPDGQAVVDEFLRSLPGRTTISDRQAELPDRMLRARYSPLRAKLDLTVSARSEAYIVTKLATPAEACRDLDPATGQMSTTLTLDFSIEARNVGDRHGQLWIVITEATNKPIAPALGAVGWPGPSPVLDPATATTVLPGPVIPVGSSARLEWQVILPDTSAHFQESRLVVGPRPSTELLAQQAERVRDATAIATWGGAFLKNDPCPNVAGTSDPQVVMIREHLARALLAISEIQGRLNAAYREASTASSDDQLAAMAEVGSWAEAEASWAEDYIKASFQNDYPVLIEWITTVRALRVMATDVVETRAADVAEVRSVTLLVDGLLGSFGPRMETQLAPPEPSQRPSPPTAPGSAILR